MKGCRPLTDEEVTRVLATFRGPMRLRNRALFTLGVKSGFRISELLSLRLGDVMQYGKIVDLVTVERRHMKKKLEGRTVLLHPMAKACILEWAGELARRGRKFEQAFLFQSQRSAGRAINRQQAWRLLKRAYHRNALVGKVATHSMRKTFAARIYDKLGKDLVQTQRALGHRNVATTMSYMAFRDEEVDNAILSL